MCAGQDLSSAGGGGGYKRGMEVQDSCTMFSVQVKISILKCGRLWGGGGGCKGGGRDNPVLVLCVCRPEPQSHKGGLVGEGRGELSASHTMGFFL